MTIDRIDHVVFTVRDLERTCEFYRRALGADVITFGDGRKALAFESCKINLHKFGAEFEPKAARPAPGTQDVCLISPDPSETIIADLQAAGVEIIEGPVRRTGALGPITSAYIRDPDGNLIEISTYAWAAA